MDMYAGISMHNLINGTLHSHIGLALKIKAIINIKSDFKIWNIVSGIIIKKGIWLK